VARVRNVVLAVLSKGEEVPSVAIAASSAGELDRELAYPAELRVSVLADEALILGAFGRLSTKQAPLQTVARRGSGGPPVWVGPGTTHVALSLVNPGALVPCDEKRIVNRYVRALLRALTTFATHSKTQAHFFGRDWVSVAHQPVAWVGFGHDASSKRTLFEAFVAVRRPFASADRASFLGREPTTLEALTGRHIDPRALAESIAEAYGRGAQIVLLPDADGVTGSLAREPSGVDDLPWQATRQEAIGVVGAGRDSQGVFRVGGDLLVSRDALARLEARVAGSPRLSADDIGRIVDETLAAPGVALDGVRSLASIRDVIAEAL
jgi:hypothetical protein